MATSATIDKRETASLIGSDKVEGTAVYGADQQKIGSLQRSKFAGDLRWGHVQHFREQCDGNFHTDDG